MQNELAKYGDPVPIYYAAIRPTFDHMSGKLAHPLLPL